MNASIPTLIGHLRPLATAMLILGAGHAFAQRNDTPPSRVQITWAPESQLSEVKNNPSWRGWLKPKDWEQALGDHLRRGAERALAPGERLEVTIDDIKLAGDFEPWHRIDMQDVRIMKDIYPPRLDLHFRVLGPDGSVLREGSAKLRDMAYLQRSVPFNNDSLRYDKRLIDDWVRRDLASHSALTAR